MMMTRSLVVLALLLFPSIAVAQEMLPTAWLFTAHFEAAPDAPPITTFEFAKASTICDQAPLAGTAPPNGPVVNPRYLRFSDPERPTRECVFDTGATSGVLFSMPFGGRYVGRLVAKADVGGVEFLSTPSDPSNPFVRGAAPAKPGAVRIAR